jgi:hypothetical protein
MLPEGDPDTTAVPFTVMVEQAFDAAGVTVIDITLTDAVYEVVPDAKAGASDPDERVRPDRSALDELQLVTVTV